MLRALLHLVPATRYARTLRLMLQRARQRRVLPPRSHPSGPAEPSEINGKEAPQQHPPMVPPPNHVPTTDASHVVTSPTISTHSGGAHQSPTFNTSGHYEHLIPGYDLDLNEETPGRSFIYAVSPSLIAYPSFVYSVDV